MFMKNFINTLRRTTLQSSNVPKRKFAQVGLAICTPPRIPCSYGEKVLHIFFMYFVWLSPTAYFLTQLKVWRREYIQSG